MSIGSLSHLYLHYPKMFFHRTFITNIGQTSIKGKAYFWIQTKETIFHPQGGGQPSDDGKINGVKVDFVHKNIAERIDQFSVLHCFLNPPALKIGDEVDLVINSEHRILNMRMHTAGHLIANLVEKCFPGLTAVGGNHFPGQGVMKFHYKEEPSLCNFNEVMTEVYKTIMKDSPTVAIIVAPNGMRSLQIGGFKSVGCGGTHVEDIHELGSVLFKDVKLNRKEKILNLKYDISE